MKERLSEGKITYTATVSFDEATYTDQQIVVLPVTGESKDPNEPGGQSGEPGVQTNGSGFGLVLLGSYLRRHSDKASRY